MTCFVSTRLELPWYIVCTGHLVGMFSWETRGMVGYGDITYVICVSEVIILTLGALFVTHQPTLITNMVGS